MTPPDPPVLRPNDAAVDVDALDAARAAATPGPWEATSPRADGGCYIDTTKVRLTDGSAPWIGRAHRERDAALIVAAVNALPELLAEVRRGRALRERMEAVLTRAYPVVGARAEGTTLVVKADDLGRALDGTT